MDNGEYVNNYIEVMTNTMTDAVVRNVSLQAQLKINEKIISELQNAVNESQQIDNEKFSELEEQISTLTSDNQRLNMMRNEYENVKHQVQHVETFRKELTAARKQVEDIQKEHKKIVDELNKKIEYLQLTPAKRKKLEEKPTEVTEVIKEEISQLPIAETETNDGGKF